MRGKISKQKIYLKWRIENVERKIKHKSKAATAAADKQQFLKKKKYSMTYPSIYAAVHEELGKEMWFKQEKNWNELCVKT